MNASAGRATLGGLHGMKPKTVDTTASDRIRTACVPENVERDGGLASVAVGSSALVEPPLPHYDSGAFQAFRRWMIAPPEHDRPAVVCYPSRLARVAVTTKKKPTEKPHKRASAARPRAARDRATPAQQRARRAYLASLPPECRATPEEIEAMRRELTGA